MKSLNGKTFYISISKPLSNKRVEEIAYGLSLKYNIPINRLLDHFIIIYCNTVSDYHATIDKIENNYIYK